MAQSEPTAMDRYYFVHLSKAVRWSMVKSPIGDDLTICPLHLTSSKNDFPRRPRIQEREAPPMTVSKNSKHGQGLSRMPRFCYPAHIGMHLPPAPVWDASVDGIDLKDFARRAQDFERSLLPRGMVFPREGQIGRPSETAKSVFWLGFQKQPRRRI